MGSKWALLLLPILYLEHVWGKLNRTREHVRQNIYEIGADEAVLGANNTDFYGYMDSGSMYEAIEYDLEEIRARPGLMSCYSCYFSSRFHGRHGSINCDEPFQPAGIPVVQCYGMCARTRVELVDDQYMIIRGCMKNCKNVYNLHSTLTCCFSHGCNSARSQTIAADTFLWLILLQFFWNC